MRTEIEQFVASLAIPDDRKAVVLAELTDHVASAAEAAVREGRDPDEAERAALGDLEALRRSLEAVEPAFRVTRRHAMGRALVAGVLVAIVIDQIGTMMMGLVGAVAAIAIAAVLAPPRVLDLLRAELRASPISGTLRVTRGVPIGPALTYAFTSMYTPIAVWIAMIVVRAYAGYLVVDVPWSAFALMSVVFAVMLVESFRMRRKAVA